jgi:hypothetical protein
VTDNETSTKHSTPASPAPRRRAPVKRRASARKPPARKKASRRPRSRARTATGLAALLDGLATKAAAAGKEVKTLSGQGTDAARRAMKDAGTASKKTIARLAKEWKGMDNARRAKFVAALLAALAAASAPIVRAGLKRKK